MTIYKTKFTTLVLGTPGEGASYPQWDESNKLWLSPYSYLIRLSTTLHENDFVFKADEKDIKLYNTLKKLRHL